MKKYLLFAFYLISIVSLAYSENFTLPQNSDEPCIEDCINYISLCVCHKGRSNDFSHDRCSNLFKSCLDRCLSEHKWSNEINSRLPYYNP